MDPADVPLCPQEAQTAELEARLARRRLEREAELWERQQQEQEQELRAHEQEIDTFQELDA